ncbi:MAG: bifunctional oligoribonuclease/PAP phosphatase NrnA [Thermoguttaceae bacterium]|jgi:phosphoesterase RecJ-like protein
MIPWSRFVDLVRSHQRFLLTCHIRPDCDALGSELGMAAVLRHLGKDVLLVNAFAVPPNLRFLEENPQTRQLGKEITAEQLADREVLVILDTTAWAQLGAMADVVRTTKAVKVVLDHHVSEDDLGAELFKDTEAEATGRLVAEAAGALGVQLTPEMAKPLFAALATDTGWFRFASTQPGTLRLAAQLVEAGARPEQLYKQLYEHDSLARLRLIGRTMCRVQTDLGGRLIYTWIEQADFQATGAVSSDSEDLINMTLTVGGTEVAVIFVEQKDGALKVSFRSRSDVDCSRLAEQFGGGGHKRAAGATLREPLASAQAKVLDAARAAMQDGG